MIVFGGCNNVDEGDLDDDDVLSSTEILDLATMQSTPGPNLPVVDPAYLNGRYDLNGRYGHSSAVLPDAKIILIGGTDEAEMIHSSVHILDPTTMQWAVGPPMATPRKGAATVVLGDGRVMVIGGLNDSTLIPCSTEVLDPDVMQWSAGPELKHPRFWAAAAVDVDGEVIVVGGTKSLYSDAVCTAVEFLCTGVGFLEHPAPLPAEPAILAPVPDCTDMLPGEIAAHLESWLTAADGLQNSGGGALVPKLAGIRKTYDQVVSLSRARRNRSLQAATALRDRKLAQAKQDFDTTSERVDRLHQKLKTEIKTARDHHLAQFTTQANAELAKLLPEIEGVRTEQADMARAAASIKRRSSNGAAAASKRRRIVEPPECAVCLDKVPDTVFQCGHEACASCAKKLKTCHTCRAKITQRIKRHGV